MEQVIQFLRENPNFFLATIDGDFPRVRPFGLIILIDGKLHICTNSHKAVFRQMMDNPLVELCSMTPDGSRFLRLWGAVSRASSAENRKVFFERAPHLANLYAGQEDSFEIFRFDMANAMFQDHTDLKQPQVLY
ncbi:MAG: pyridoxamine 5'-phosphate oxidase family protein [Prevotellaceae bacterium]|jgi:uncharacterized pyridoxamine 5'-phosphate oxidase family protein|nr:pyridoxamine 5'-phosphate oxidase family protein [Prevotellaceae bacterium]